MTSVQVSPTGAVPMPARAGDDAAAWAPTIEGTYRELAPAVLGYFRSHGMDGAEDLVGEVFVSVARSISRFRGDAGDLRRWVFTIARRRRVDQIRRVVRQRSVVTSDPPDRPVADSTSGIDTDLLDALHDLTTLQREVVALRFVADLSIEQVARVVRRSPGAVKALQVRALSQLAQRIPPNW